MAGPDTSSSWSDLPTDLLLSILELVELPEALAFAAVCTSWCSAATAAGIPSYCTPWLMSWAYLVEERESKVNNSNNNSAVICKFRHLLDVDKDYDVTFPKGCFVTCCGSSHGWLVLVNELCNLLLYNPFTSDMIPLPPITDFSFVEAVYDDKQGKMEGYRVANGRRLYDANYLATFFYTKAVLSRRPSKGGNYVLATIHHDSNWVSFARAGEGRWQVVSTLEMNQGDRYADCAYHNDRLYTVTYYGIVERWNLDEANGPTKEVLVAKRQHEALLTRHLVPAPWGDLLQVSAIYEERPIYDAEAGVIHHFEKHEDRQNFPYVRFVFRKVNVVGRKELPRQDLGEHALFLGLNHSACLPTNKFRGIRPHVIYFSAPWMTYTFGLLGRRGGDWGGVRAYDLLARTAEIAFPLRVSERLINPPPTEIWIIPNM
ncbi:hypothetical protein ACQ4PT_043528 [Festuca glaucescens]